MATGILLTVAFIVAYFVVPNIVKADSSGDWMSGNINLSVDTERTDGTPTPWESQAYCEYRDVYIDSSTTTTNICVHQAKTFQFARTQNIIVELSGDDRFHTVSNLGSSTGAFKSTTNTDTLIFDGGYWYPPYLLPDLPSHLTKQPDGTYIYDSSMYYPVISSTGSYKSMTMGISRNGEWAVVEIMGVGLARINLKTYEYTLFTKDVASYGSGSDPTYEYTVSDDGKYVFTYGQNVHANLYYISDACGLRSSGGVDPSAQLNTPCETRDIVYPALQTLGYDMSLRIARYASFNESDDQLSMYATLNHYTPNAIWMTLYLDGHDPANRLEYLAMGDSYSSGEGDTELTNTGKSHYINGTDVNGDNNTPTEKCHISDRSYPFLLAKDMGLSKDQWASVACSGATTDDISGSSTYDGQPWGDDNKSRLAGFSNEAELQADALSGFTPGRIRQIDFVKKYQPKIITVGIGGNDIRFGDFLEDCAGTSVLSDCPYVTSDDMKSSIGVLIYQLRPKYVAMLRALVEASNYQSKIYVIGYPITVDDEFSNALCGLNVRLTNEERKFIVESTKYLNNVIKSAADQVGVKYIDAENAFGNNKLCDNANPEVTGIVDPFNIKKEQQNSFHPTAAGHKKLYNSIINNLDGQTPATYDNCGTSSKVCPVGSTTAPSLPDYFADPNNNVTLTKVVVFASVTAAVVAMSVATPIAVPIAIVGGAAGLFLSPDSPFEVLIYSYPQSLGSYTANEDGTFSQTVSLPAGLPTGYHTLVVSGEDENGNPVRILQTILVINNDPNDIDGNGIPDNQQGCVGVESSSIDADMDGKDDACDEYIGDAPQLYRVRSGDVTRLYDGLPERSNYMYVERNTHTSSITGISGDYDPDGDGWAVVGSSQGLPYTETSVPDTGPAANFLVKGTGSRPYVYIRAGGYGCVEYAPVSLTVVTAGQNRTLKRTQLNTDSCREQDPSDDVDGDGVPDSEQTLYIARKGDPNISHTKSNGTVFNEDPNKLYILRNFYAAEAQLGISDYSPTGTAAGDSNNPIAEWGMLASTQKSQYIPDYNKLVTIDANGQPMPIILTKKQNGQCIAYEPESTSLIKKTTEYTRDIIKLSVLPQGVNCD